MKIAVFDVSHWHFPLYIPALKDPGIEVIGISDSASFAGPRFADLLNCKLYGSNDELMSQDFDFALVFSRHSDMAKLAESSDRQRQATSYREAMRGESRGSSSYPQTFGEAWRLCERASHYARERPGRSSLAGCRILARGFPASFLQVYRGVGCSL
ncbi:hypothetical protein [Rhizobium leguminosarum]|uniref:hypothetical protein n=1 Tax=Rhizobium leguminosarum TaxID=384 RepID=UPI002FF16D55